jgi:isopenicillin N synthase-like dioxygenase
MQGLGFFFIRNHKVSVDLMDSVMRTMHEFFEQPSEIKKKIKRSSSNPWGYNDQELTKETRDWKEIFDIGVSSKTSPFIENNVQWPDQLPDFKITMKRYFEECELLSFKLLSAISCNMGMPADYLEPGFKPEHSSYLRLNYYPLCPEPAEIAALSIPQSGHLGINHHTDSGAITVLLMDSQPGLEVFHQNKWHSVNSVRNCLLVNIGDMIQVMSNDNYAAPIHRVRADSKHTRYSAPFFFNPSYATDYAPFSRMCTDQVPHYKSINWGEFRFSRASGDYASDGEEVQISQYRIKE